MEFYGQVYDLLRSHNDLRCAIHLQTWNDSEKRISAGRKNQNVCAAPVGCHLCRVTHGVVGSRQSNIGNSRAIVIDDSALNSALTRRKPWRSRQVR
jgi:hypothetical protein